MQIDAAFGWMATSDGWYERQTKWITTPACRCTSPGSCRPCAAWCPAATRSRLEYAGAGASARLVAIVQATLIAQLILRVEAIPIVQTILVLLASLIGGRSSWQEWQLCACGHHHDHQRQDGHGSSDWW